MTLKSLKTKAEKEMLDLIPKFVWERLGADGAIVINALFLAFQLGQEEEKEICICAAIRLQGGFIARGQRHSDCRRIIEDVFRDRDFKVFDGREEEGFITSKNRFVDRFKGLELQRKAGIKSNDGTYSWKEGLYSEDLY